MSRILVIHHPVVRALLVATGERLRREGMDVTEFDDWEAFAAARPGRADFDILLLGSGVPCPQALMASIPALRAVVYIGAGTGSVSLADANALGILVAHGAAILNAESMAESVIMLMLALLHDMHRTEQVLIQNLPRPPWPRARMLRGKTLGLIGYGNIARAVVARLGGWAVDILVHSRRAIAAELPPHTRQVDLPELLRSSDVVSLHGDHRVGAPALIGTNELSQMKTAAVLINTARGGLIDEEALARALRDRSIAAAALDTFESEPLPSASPLRGLSNVILTPHAIGHTIEGYESMVETAVENVRRLCRGQAPLHARNPEILPVWQKRYATSSGNGIRI